MRWPSLTPSSDRSVAPSAATNLFRRILIVNELFLTLRELLPARKVQVAEVSNLDSMSRARAPVIGCMDEKSIAKEDLPSPDISAR